MFERKVGTMGMKTSRLAWELGMNSQEVNILLRDEGYLEGEPNDWRLTEKGNEYAHQQHWDVSAPRHAGYIITEWDDRVLEELGQVSPERKQEIRDEIAARRAKQRSQREKLQAECEDEAEDDFDSPDCAVADDGDIDIDGKTVGIAIAVVAGGILLARGIKWAKPRVEKWWGETAQPKLAASKERVIAKFKKSEDGQAKIELSDPEDVEETVDMNTEEPAMG